MKVSDIPSMADKLLEEYNSDLMIITDIFDCINNSEHEHLKQCISDSYYLLSYDFSLNKLNQVYWMKLLTETQVLSLMDRETRSTWESSCKHSKPHKPCNFTEDNVYATLNQIYGNRFNMRLRAIDTVFKGLSWDYKTNNGVMFGDKVVLNRFHNGYLICPEVRHSLDDLQREHLLYDGKDEVIGDDTLSRFFHLNFMIREVKYPYIYEDVYFHIKIFKKGTLHLKFKRPDIIKHLNKMLSESNKNKIPENKKK
jgi:hypothetical protein